MDVLFSAMMPEMVLAAVACGLFLLGLLGTPAARRLSAAIAVATLAGIFLFLRFQAPPADVLTDAWGTVRVFHFALYIKMVAAGIGLILALLAWPANRQGTGNAALDFGPDAGEFFALLLLCIAGIFIVAGANNLILLFLGIELASIPTYILVTISRPQAAAQEAGVKYFFLGAMAAAVLLFGFSYLYGTTGQIDLDRIAAVYQSAAASPQGLSAWQILAVVLVIGGLAFKIAAVPMHFYVADVYQGAATAVTALLGFVPKISGMVALLKILYLVGGEHWAVPGQIAKLLWILAVLSMSVGNVLGLLQFNVKRVFAYSSVAHSGYMLVGIATLVSASHSPAVQNDALMGVLFYLAAYALMNTGALGVLTLLPNRQGQPATGAESFEDLAGQGRRRPGIGLAMSICCFSLIGIPLTAGFFGKLLLIGPALHGGLYGLVIIMVINVAVSAAYYLRIIATMFLRADPADVPAEVIESESPEPFPVLLAVAASVFGTLALGIYLPATSRLTNRAHQAVQIEPPAVAPLAQNMESVRR